MSRRTPASVPHRPRVNLLSSSEFARQDARRLRHRFAAAGVALLMLVGAATALQHVRVEQARKLVAVEEAETNRLATQTRRLAPVRAFVDGVARQERTVGTAMAPEVWLSDVYRGIQDATPLGAHLGTVNVTLSGPVVATDGAAAPAADRVATSCPGPDPFKTRVLAGCVELSGTASSRAEVGEMVVNLGDSGLFVEPFITTTTTGEGQQVSFSGTVGLSQKAYSRRYADPTAPAQAAPAQPGQSAPTPTAPTSETDTAEAQAGGAR